MAKTKFDYKKIKFDEMAKYIIDNDEKLFAKDEESYVKLLTIAIKRDKKQTLAMKKPFYDLTKDEIDFVNPPIKKAKAKTIDENVKKLQELRNKYHIKETVVEEEK